MGKVVCVTGGSGYIASWLVNLLLHRGYTVRATVRNLSDANEVAHLKALEGAKERLHLFEADLLDQGSFDSVIYGCVCVFHTASPVFFTSNDPQRELIDPAVKGTLNVLSSCEKASSSVKRVVLTSSIATMKYTRNPPNPDFLDETWFSDPSFCEEKKEWYGLSKTLAEKAARKFTEEKGIDLVTLHPGYVIGPLLQPTLNFSSQAFVNLIKQGNGLFSGSGYQHVDVRDVAQAHILAFENPLANGRYCLVGRIVNSSQVFHILKEIYPSSFNLVSNASENQDVKSPYQISKKKVESLGVKFTPIEVTLRDMVENLKEKNFLSF